MAIAPPMDVRDDEEPVPKGTRRDWQRHWWPIVGIAIIAGMFLLSQLMPTPHQRSIVTAPPLTPAEAAGQDDSMGWAEAGKQVLGALTAPAGSPVVVTPDPVPSGAGRAGGTPQTARAFDPQAEITRRLFEARFSSNRIPSSATAPTAGAGTRAAPVRAAAAPTLEDFVAVAEARQQQQRGATSAAPPGLGPQSPAQAASPVPTPAPPVSQTATAAAATSSDPSAQPKPGLHRVRAGTVIMTLLENRVITLGPVRGLVSEDVYAFDGTLVIPHGAKILGEATPLQSTGTPELAVAYHTLQFPAGPGTPQGSDLALPQLPGMDPPGDLGVTGRVNTHAWSRFGAAALVSVISGLGQAVGNIGRRNGSTVITGTSATGISQAAGQILAPYNARPTSIETDHGARIHVYVRTNLDLPAWAGE